MWSDECPVCADLGFCSDHPRPMTLTGDDLIERVARALHAEMLDMEAGEGGCHWNELDEHQRAMIDLLAKAALTTLEPELLRLREEVERLREALAPFANCVDQIAIEEDDEEWAKFRLLIKDYRRAAVALQINQASSGLEV